MRIIDRIKNLFKRGGYALTGKTLKSINDHPKVNLDPAELARIERNFRDYEGKHPKVEYVNSNGDKMKRDYMHINMTKLSAELMASLIFNEQCEVNISDAKEDGGTNSYKTAHDFISHVFEHNDFKKNLSEYLEPMLAIGGLAVRPYVDQATGNIEYSWALANAFYPLRSNSNGISEGVMKSITMKIQGGKEVYYTLLEFHEWENAAYVITNELYKSDNKAEIGKRVPLSELYEELEEETVITNLTRPNFNYLKPAGFNNINAHSPLGLGLTDNCKPTLRQINDTYDEFRWEIKMGQRTVFVSDHLLQTLPDENGMPPKQVFDPDVNVYKTMRMGMDEELIKDATSDIRSSDYIASINNHLRTFEMETKLSTGTFSFDGKSMKTAREVTSEDSLTFRTRNNQVNSVEKFIKGLIISTLELAKATTFNGKRLYTGEIPTAEDIGVDFDDGVFVDKEQELNFYGKAKTFGLVPTVEIIQRVFKVPKETAEQWIDEIEREQGAVDPMNISDRAARHLFGDEE